MVAAPEIFAAARGINQHVRLDRIGTARQVIIVGGEDCRDALETATERTVVSWTSITDWSPLAGRNVVIWPDADGPSLSTANEIAAILVGLGCTVRVMDVMRDDPPKGWDAADAIRDGWGKGRLDGFMRETVRPWSPSAPLAAAQKPAPSAGLVAQVSPAKPVRVAGADEFKRREQDITSRQLDVVGVLPQPASEVNSGGQLDRMVPAHHVVWGSEVEIAGILARELSGDRGGYVVRAEGGFWAFEGSQWSEIPEQRMRLMVHMFDGARVGDKGTPLKVGRRMIDGVLSELGAKLGKSDFFECATVGINAANGVVVFDEAGTPALRPHSADDRFRFTIPADFKVHDDMEPPDGSYLHHLLSGAFRGDGDAHEKQQLIGEMLGAAALGLATRLPQPKAFVFLGETASNGKSTIARLLSSLLPAGAVSSIPPAAFGDERRIVNLAGKAANVADELSASAIAGEAFKAAVTGDPLEGRDLYRSAVTFRPRALHCFTTNTLPRFNGGLDRGLQRRLVVVRFNRSIPRDEIIPDIADRIRSAELHLLLQFAVAGAQRLIQRKAYTIPASSKEALQSWLMLDPVNEWLAGQTVRTDNEPPDGWLSTGKLYAAFKGWALEEGHSERFLPPVNTFSQRLKASGVQISRRSTGSVAMGIKLAGLAW
ncbi:DUF5906 domain-containing protein [Bradyrhizobium sp. BEA-2-5]|uniref:DNA primase family protein n=1 Tax=Bradyrhizobium sp. BEA-2-5 TaxID=3080015 RepID=UPI00293EE2D1|nr:DUF5906 domain-containing protein [Bradyrhizobium sp. BEA-2-5]WOH79010.1 DUF5906 domain-containing protein [Bradyrhizobium sp. BEA-2-5]